MGGGELWSSDCHKEMAEQRLYGVHADGTANLYDEPKSWSNDTPQSVHNTYTMSGAG